MESVLLNEVIFLSQGAGRECLSCFLTVARSGCSSR
jgi:hypothetical protein